MGLVGDARDRSPRDGYMATHRIRADGADRFVAVGLATPEGVRRPPGRFLPRSAMGSTLAPGDLLLRDVLDSGRHPGAACPE